MLLLALLACDGELPPTSPTANPNADCTPEAGVFDTNVTPALQAGCQSCHGAQPSFGAPMPLVTYDDLMAPYGEDGRRVVDSVLDTLLDSRMPPSNAEPLTHAHLDTLVGWASCGREHPPAPVDLVADREVWQAAPAPPEGATPLDLTAVDEVIGPDVLDDYRSFTFRDLVTEPMHVRRIEPIIDDDRVLHHITLTGASGVPYYYAWAPGTGPMDFPGGGVRIDAGTRLRVEIHYNNGAGVPDAVDSSGVRLWIDTPEGEDWAVMSPQSWFINVPPNGSSQTNQACTATSPFTVHAAMPHMHEIGSAFTHVVERGDGTEQSLISLQNWSFESQYIYAIGVDVQPGDRLEMECIYDNPTDRRVMAGTGTQDEMCFNFMYVTPASAVSQCSGPF